MVESSEAFRGRKSELIDAIRNSEGTSTIVIGHSENWTVFDDHIDLRELKTLPALQFRNCRFDKGLSLDGCQVDGDLTLSGCEIEGELSLQYTDVRGNIYLADAQLSATSEAFENAENGKAFVVRGKGLRARRLDANAARFKGTVHVGAARFEDAFNLDGAQIENPIQSGRSLYMHRMDAAEVSLCEAKFIGEVMASRMRIRAEFNCTGASLETTSGDDWAFNGTGARAELWNMAHVTIRGHCCLDDLRVEGQVVLEGASLSAGEKSVSSLHGNRIRCGSLNLDHMNAAVGVKLRDLSSEYGISFRQAHIVPSFPSDLAGSQTIDAPEIGLDITGATIDGNVNGREARIENTFGVALSLDDARVLGAVNLYGAQFLGAVDLNGTKIDGGIDLRRSTCTASFTRAIGIQNANINGTVDLTETILHGHIHANRSTIDGDLNLRDLKAAAAIFDGPTRGMSPRIVLKGDPDIPENTNQGKRLSKGDPEDFFRQCRWRHHVVVWEDATVTGKLSLPRSVPRGWMTLCRSSCRTLEDWETGWPKDDDRDEYWYGARAGENSAGLGARIELEGFEASYFSHPSGTDRDTNRSVLNRRKTWLSRQPDDALGERFNPQPWKMTSNVLRRMGYSRSADEISTERLKRAGRSKSEPIYERGVSGVVSFTSGHGYRPWRALFFSLAIIVLFAVAYVGIARYGEQEVMVLSAEGYKPAKASFGVALAYSADLFVPIVDFDVRRFWYMDMSTNIGVITYALSVLERIVGGIMTFLIVLGFTGLTRRDER